MRPDEKWSVGTVMDLEVNDSVTLYGEVMMTNYETKAQIAESGTFFAEEYYIDYDSALLNDSHSDKHSRTLGVLDLAINLLFTLVSVMLKAA